MAYKYAGEPKEQIIFEDYLVLLPKPLQTLLKALLEIKCDLLRELNTLETNATSNHNNEILSECTKNFEIIKCGAQQILSLKKRNISLAKENFEFTGQLTEPNLIELINLLSEKRQSHYSAFESRKSLLMHEFSPDLSLQQASNAIQESEALRARLIALAQGPLSKLFESQTIEPEAPQDSLIQTVEGHINIPEEPIEQKKLAAFIRKVRYSNDTIAHELLDDKKNIFSDVLKQIGPKQFAELNLKFTNSESLKIADKKIQAEIGLVMQTLTIDRSILNKSLKSIVQKCQALKESYANQSKNMLYHNLQEMQSKYSEASQILLNAYI